MFKQLRRKMTLNSMIVLAGAILILFGGIFIINVVQLYSDINEKIELTSVRLNDRIAPKQDGLVIPQGCIVLIVDNATGEMFASTNFEDYYTEDELRKIVGIIMQESGDSAGRVKENGKYLAYRKMTDVKYLLEDNTRIVIYDFSTDMQSIGNLLMALGLCYVAGLVICFVFVYKFVDNAVKPIEAAFVKQRELVANASHELKTPITVIKTSLSLIDADGDADENKKWLRSISGQTERMSNMIKEMLELAKMDSNAQNVSLHEVEISKIVKGVLLDMEVVAFERGLNLTSEIKPDLKTLGDKGICEKIAYILLENAMKYTNPNGTIRVKLYQDKRKKVVFSVFNTGKDIKKEAIPKLFDRFYRAEESHTNVEGEENHSFGLGLAILKSLTENIGAEIEVQSEEGKYTEFSVYFK